MSKQDRRGAIDQALDQMFEDEEAAMEEMVILENELFGYDDAISQAEASSLRVKREHREKERPRKMRGYAD